MNDLDLEHDLGLSGQVRRAGHERLARGHRPRRCVLHVSSHGPNIVSRISVI